MTRAKRKRTNYYMGAIRNRVDRLDLLRAGEANGIGDEVALVRHSMKKAMGAAARTKKAQRDFKTASAGLAAVSRALAAEARMGRRTNGELGRNIEAVLTELGDLLLPADEGSGVK